MDTRRDGRNSPRRSRDLRRSSERFQRHDSRQPYGEGYFERQHDRAATRDCFGNERRRLSEDAHAAGGPPTLSHSSLKPYRSTAHGGQDHADFRNSSMAAHVPSRLPRRTQSPAQDQEFTADRDCYERTPMNNPPRTDFVAQCGAQNERGRSGGSGSRHEMSVYSPERSMHAGGDRCAGDYSRGRDPEPDQGAGSNNHDRTYNSVENVMYSGRHRNDVTAPRRSRDDRSQRYDAMLDDHERVDGRQDSRRSHREPDRGAGGTVPTTYSPYTRSNSGDVGGGASTRRDNSDRRSHREDRDGYRAQRRESDGSRERRLGVGDLGAGDRRQAPEHKRGGVGHLYSDDKGHGRRQADYGGNSREGNDARWACGRGHSFENMRGDQRRYGRGFRDARYDRGGRQGRAQYGEERKRDSYNYRGQRYDESRSHRGHHGNMSSRDDRRGSASGEARYSNHRRPKHDREGYGRSYYGSQGRDASHHRGDKRADKRPRHGDGDRASGVPPPDSADNSDSDSALGIRDGQWVGHSHADAAGNDSREGLGSGGTSLGIPGRSQGTRVTIEREGGRSKAFAGLSSGSQGFGKVPCTSQVTTGTPRRPRWDKAGPSASGSVTTATTIGSEPSKPGHSQQDNTNKKKLVWGGGDNASKKRSLWSDVRESGNSEHRNARAPDSEQEDLKQTRVEQRWQQAATALGPADRQAKFLRLLGAKGAASATAAGSLPAGGDAEANEKVMSDLETHYQKAHRAHFGYQRGLGN